MRGDLRRCEAAETEWKLKATARAATIEELEQHKSRQEEKLRTMEAARRRLDEAKRDVEAVAAQVNPLKERVAGLITERDNRDELIVRLKGDAKIEQEKFKRQQKETTDWKVQVAGLVDRIHDQDAQLLTLQQALVEKYEDIREQVFSAEQMERYHKFESERLKKALEARGARPIDVGVQTVMPGDDAQTQVNFPKLERLKKFAPDDTVLDVTQQYEEAAAATAALLDSGEDAALDESGGVGTQTGPVESGAPKQLQWNDT